MTSHGGTMRKPETGNMASLMFIEPHGQSFWYGLKHGQRHVEACWNMLKHVETAICWHMRRLPSKVHEGIHLRRMENPPGDPDGLHCPHGQSPNFSPWKSPFFSMENQLEGLGHEVSIATLVLQIAQRIWPVKIDLIYKCKWNTNKMRINAVLCWWFHLSS